ncbi:MAG: hypothetical protein WAU42_11440, partial [Solirubrobacteraceae bacterium]
MFCVIATSVIGAASASAATFKLALWLEAGANVTETMLVETSGSLILENTKAPGINSPAAVECSSVLVGDVGPNGADDVTEALNLS